MRSFVGHGIDGFDTLEKRFVTMWVDSMSTQRMVFEGTHDVATKTLTMTGEGYDPMTGKLTRYRTETEMKDPDSMIFRMFKPGESGTDVETMRIEYKRGK